MGRRNSPVKGHHGIGARGQGKLLYYHTQIPRKVAEEAKSLPREHDPKAPVKRRTDGRWTD